MYTSKNRYDIQLKQIFKIYLIIQKPFHEDN